MGTEEKFSCCKSPGSFCALGAALIATAIMLGAFGAHGLKDILDERGVAIYEKAALYHFISALGILAGGICVQIGLLAKSHATWVVRLLMIGICLFSGSLYLLAITQERWLGMITPVGGSCFIIGWLVFAWGCWRARAVELCCNNSRPVEPNII